MIIRKIKKILNKLYLKIVKKLGNKVEVIPPKKSLYVFKMGTIKASYSEIVKTFGKPSVYRDFVKDIDVIWQIKITDDQTATIYSQKKTGNVLGVHGIDKNVYTVWSIGGQSRLAILFVYSMMGRPLTKKEK